MLDLSNKRSLYNIYTKRKSNGKKRVIFAPLPELKAEQKKLANRLEELYDPPECVFGYIKGRCAADLARLHVGKDWVITIDIKDFFPSITLNWVSAIVGNDYDAEIATYNGRCVQGSPASPIISNIFMQEHDEVFDMWFGKFNICYTRYSDDIQLSGFGKPNWQLVNVIRIPLKYELGLELNDKKIKFMFKNQRQEVLGLCVNDKVSVSRKVRSQLKFRADRGMLDVHDVGMLNYINGVIK